ncbi:protein KASH5-like [Thunnus thynnus]|uniref:protein KASH5-like n=1 Tax=Thunnus thynnus TaxID=8237 RepID=UPI0035275C5E
MDFTEENMTPKEMLEKIAELDYSQSQLRELNTEMRHWLDVADDDMAVLRSDNTALRKQVKVLEKMVSDVQQVEAEPCRLLPADDPDVKRRNEKHIQNLEKEYTIIKEHNKKLTAEIKSVQQQTERDKNSLSKLTVALQTLEYEIEEAQLGLQHREELINQKNLMLKHAEETVEECSVIIQDLKLTNQELRRQLDNQQDEASFAILNDMMGEKEGSHVPPLSFAEEIKLLASLAEVKSSMSHSTYRRHEETETEELLVLGSLTFNPQYKRCAVALETAVQKAGLLMLFIFTLAVLAFVASGSCAGDFFSINTLWSSTHLMLQPYCRVHYGALPPV